MKTHLDVQTMGSYPAVCQRIVFGTGASKFLEQHKRSSPLTPQATVADWIRPPGVVLRDGGIHPRPPAKSTFPPALGNAHECQSLRQHYKDKAYLFPMGPAPLPCIEKPLF